MAPTAMLILATVPTMAAALAPVNFAQFNFVQPEGSENCECATWKDAYAQGRHCGNQLEFFYAARTQTPNQFSRMALEDTLGGVVCQGFFQVLNNNYCVNVDQLTDQGQWCMVDPACKQLNGGVLTGDGAWKKCQPGVDKMLGDHEPAELAKMAATDRLDLAMMNKMSYSPHSHLWSEVCSFWNVSLTTAFPDTMPVPEQLKSFIKTPSDFRNFMAPRWGDGTIAPELSEEMQAIKASGKPYYFETHSDRAGTQVVVKGDQVYLSLGGPVQLLMCLKNC